MDRKTNEFRSSQRFSFLSRVILTNWENPLVNYDQIYKVRQRFYNTKVLRVVCLIEIQTLKRALAQTVRA